MTTQSVANNSAGPTKSQIPAIRTFQFDESAIGQIKSGVNYFRGSVQLPIDFVQLTGREGLDVKVSVAYSSSIKNQVAIWNSEAPTGVLGLGWEMPLNYISVVKAGSGSNTSDSFYLVADGSGNPLVKTGEAGGGVWLFQTRNYEFWDIRYDTVNQIWTITQEDGFIHTYGGKENPGALQYGVAWGNWIGSSGQLAGQQQYCAAWNLASIESPWGHRVSYAYDNVMQAVGQGGKEFTQASYIKQAVDSYDRTITFNYGEKYGAGNTSPRNIIEYQARNTGLPEPNAFQDKYETRFLDSVAVKNAEGQELYRLQFAYDFINTAISSDPAYPLLWKRVLKSAFQYSPTGASAPGMRFDYAGQNDVNPGALKSVTYPSGGVARIEYKKVLINAPKHITVANPLPGSTPGVWHGDDYVAFTFCRPDSAGVNVLVRAWDGRWVESDVTAPGMVGVQADPKSVRVLSKSDFLAVSLRNKTASRDELYIYQRDKAGFGEWQLVNQQPFLLNLKPNAGDSTFVAGSDFVVAYNKDYTTDAVQGFSYYWKTDQWTRPTPLPMMGGETDAVIAAEQNYYIVARYLKDQRQAEFQILYRDLEKNWRQARSWTASNFEVVEAGGRLLFALNAQPTFVVATHVTNSGASKISYRLDIFDWNENFDVLNASNPASVDLESPLKGGKSVYDIFRTIVTGAYVNNNPANLRTLGETGSSGLPVIWEKREFSRPTADSTIETAAGEDVAMLCENTGGVQKNQLLTFDPNFPSSPWQTRDVTQAGRYPTVSGDFLTVGKTIYARDFKGVWTPLSQQLEGLVAEETVQNRAPSYIAFQDTDKANAKSYFVAVKNGQAASPVELPGGAQRISVSASEPCAGPGANLAGRFLVSYSSASFCDADKLFLLNLDESDLGDYVYDYPVASIEIENMFDPAQSFVQSYFYMNSDQSQISYNSATGVTQYPLVYELPGVKSTLETPPSIQPHGRSERYYSNGLSPQRGLYPSTWRYNYQHILNGMLLAQKDFDSENILTSSQLNYWKVFTDDANARANLYGGYVRPVRTTIITNDVVSDATSEFDATTGVQLWQEQKYYDSEGKARFQRSEKRYAWQVPQYKSTFLKHHIYTAVVQNIVSVTEEGAEARNYVASDATTYRNWALDEPAIECPDGAGDQCKLAPYQQYAWTTPGAAPPEFDFAQGAERNGWLLTSEVTTRAKAQGVVTEQRDVNGVPRSFLYDKQQRYRVAEFPDGSLDGDEVSYYGFENYEDGSGWVLGPGAKIVPDSENAVVDAHVGTHSLHLGPATTDKNGVSRTFMPSRRGRRYIFSAWVKKPAGFDKAQGDARWQLNITGGENATLEFPDTVGRWVYVFQVVDVPVGSGGVEILGQNLNAASGVLVDDLRFSPLSSQFEGAGYDTRMWLANAGLGANGESDRTAYSIAGRPAVMTNGADVLTKIQTTYFSRTGNEGRFSTTDPNLDASYRNAGTGRLDTFTRGSEWQELWRPTPDVWVVEQNLLTQKSTNLPGSLAIDDAAYGADYVLDVGLVTRETITRPLGVRFGASLVVQWDPQKLEWQLLDGDGRSLADPVDALLFTVPKDPFAAELQGGDVSDELHHRFNLAGYALPAGATVSPGLTPDKSWVLTSPTGEFRYELLEEGENIGVHRVVGGWTALVADRALVFSAAGRRIFSYQAPEPLAAAAPELFFGSRVAISRLAIGQRPQAEMSYTDSTGNPIQLQALADDRAVVSQTIPDNMGRPAIRTKSAYVTPEVNPLLAYCGNFASVDWSTGKMTGLVNDAYPEDGGFPYSRETYERSAQSRVVEQGVPGELFRIGAQSTCFAYSGADGKFQKTTTTNPNGDEFYELANQLDQVVRRVAINDGVEVRNQTIFDDAGNPQYRRAPNYFNPPAGSTKDDWVETDVFDYAGRVTSSFSSGKQGETKYIYDRAGNMRFMQDPQGAQDGDFNYVKYDLLGRQIETGYIHDAWNAAKLQQYANADPAWPATPLTWRKKYTYDGGQEIRFAIGRVIEVRINNTDDDVTDVVEGFRYDVLGNTTVRTLVVDEFDPCREHRVDYEYDNLNAIARITYPDVGDAERLQVHQRANRLNQLVAISETADFTEPLATFSYRANGQPLDELLHLGGEQIKQTYQFNSPLWLEKLEQQNSAGDVLFGESLTYTEGGYEDAKYYDGTIASATFTGSSDYQFQYAYNAIGAIQTADNNKHDDWDLGVTKNLDYDANGNFALVERGGVERKYQYFTGTQRVQDVRNAADDSLLASYDYDHNGAAVKANSAPSGFAEAHDLSFTYDPGVKMTRRIVDTAAGGDVVVFRYGHDDDRVLKDVSRGGVLAERKLYIRGLSEMPLCELNSAGQLKPAIYIYGPSGLLAMHRDNAIHGVLKDHLGSVRAVLDSRAQVVASYDYLTYGALAKVNEPVRGFMPYLFTGQEFDWETGLYNYRARFYAAELGRFLEVDPQKQFFSPYLYSSNNPVLFVDPTGGISTWARVLFGVGMAIVGIGLTVLTIATAGAASPAVAAWAVGLGASTGVAAALGTTAAIATSAALGAASGAALGGAFYSLGTSNEEFSWERLGQQAALGAIAGAITGGVAQGFSIAGQAVATAATKITAEGAEWAASQTTQLFAKYVARQALVGGVSSALGGAASSGVSGAVSNVWGLTDMGPSDMAFSILSGLGMGAVKGAAGGVGGAAWSVKIKAPALRVWGSLSTKQQVVGGTVGGVVVVGGSYGYLYNREVNRERARQGR